MDPAQKTERQPTSAPSQTAASPRRRTSVPPRRYPSRFGGLWIDREDAEQQIAARRAAGTLTAHEVEQLLFWRENGYLILEDAAPAATVDRVLADIETAWAGGFSRSQIEFPKDGAIRIERPDPAYRGEEHKLLSLHAQSEATREALFAGPILYFLALIYGRAPLAFSTLVFERGTRQPVHQDTAYVAVDAPMEMAASWIALEDVMGNCGPLEYYAGSHRIPESLFPGGRKLMPVELQTDERYHHHLQALCEQQGCRREVFRPRKGTALLWHADLVHGGLRDVAPGTSRKSLVTHYCPVDHEPAYFDYWKHSGKLRHAPGAYYSWYQR